MNKLNYKYDIKIFIPNKLFNNMFVIILNRFSYVFFDLILSILYKLKNRMVDKINLKYLKLKGLLVSLLIIIAILAIPLVSMPGNKFIKHPLEWDYFVGVISFYLLTFFMWKKNTNS